MKSKFPILKQFNWKVLLIRILVNAVAIVLTTALVPKIYFIDRSLSSVLLVAITLGLMNAIIKPALLFLTAQLFFATFGLLIILITTFLIYLISWIFPTILAVDSLIWALVAGAVLGLATNALENLLGLTPPIVPDEQAEIKRQIMEKSVTPLQNLAGMKTATIHPGVETQSIEEVKAARAALDLINAVAAAPPESDQPPPSTPPPDEMASIEVEPQESAPLVDDTDSNGGQS